EDKMIEPMDAMAVILTHKLITIKEENSTKDIEKIDFPGHFNQVLINKLMEPITSHKPHESLPEISGYALKLMREIQD
ncbi:MAG: hypothetical protein QM503_02070, partial [Bacteroidota bacterium]